ncbi:MAG: phosphomannose isomerase type II C-terminal cupin domain [bacterium]
MFHAEPKITHITTEIITEERPWGTFSVIETGLGYKVKKLVIYPQKRLSLQLHRHRAEHWVVVEGSPYLVCNEISREFNVGENLFIPSEAIHRIENKSSVNASIIEVQIGSYLGEDDIVRLEDDFNRTEKRL